MSDVNRNIAAATSKLKAHRNTNQIDGAAFGKVQPQAIPLEQAVLGAILLDKEALSIVTEILRRESFYLDTHKEIYAVMEQLYAESGAIDLLTVHEGLKQSGKLDMVGGFAYLSELTNMVASTANIEFHARIVAQKFIQRELIRVSSKIINDSFDETKDVFELLDEAEQHLYEITDQNLNTGYQSLSKLAIKAQKEIELISEKDGDTTGVPTGYVELDKLTSGWQPSDLIIIAARPGMGKTAFTLSLAKNAAENDKGVAIFSLEMADVQLTTRLISMEAEISSENLRSGKLDDDEWKRLHAAVDKLTHMPIYIDDTPGINIFELRAKCRRLKQNHDISMIVIDYLQLMSGAPNDKRGNREQEISSISRALKGLAKELDVPVIALSQLSRAVETRGGEKRPMLSDLRESGAIEQDADIVTFIYRPGYYRIEEDDVETPKDLTEIIIAKQRNGGLGTVELRFIGQFVKFEDPGEGGFTNDFGDFQAAIPPNMITRSSKASFEDDFSEGLKPTDDEPMF